MRRLIPGWTDDEIANLGVCLEKCHDRIEDLYDRDQPKNPGPKTRQQIMRYRDMFLQEIRALSGAIVDIDRYFREIHQEKES